MITVIQANSNENIMYFSTTAQMIAASLMIFMSLAIAAKYVKHNSFLVKGFAVITRKVYLTF